MKFCYRKCNYLSYPWLLSALCWWMMRPTMLFTGWMAAAISDWKMTSWINHVGLLLFFFCFLFVLLINFTFLQFSQLIEGTEVCDGTSTILATYLTVFTRCICPALYIRFIINAVLNVHWQKISLISSINLCLLSLHCIIPVLVLEVTSVNREQILRVVGVASTLMVVEYFWGI